MLGKNPERMTSRVAHNIRHDQAWLVGAAAQALLNADAGKQEQISENRHLNLL